MIIVRLVPKRNAGHISPNDMLIAVVIGAMRANAIMGAAASAGDVLFMIVVILLWGYGLDVVEDRVPFVRRLMRHKQTLLVQDGRVLRRNMRHEMITEEEPMAVMRREGLDELSAVKSATLEADGEISVIKKRVAG